MGNLRESLQIEVVSNTQGWACCQNKVSASGGSQGQHQILAMCLYKGCNACNDLSDEKETMTGSSEM
jgi:hypothetical protein